MAKNTKILILFVWTLFATHQAIAGSVNSSSSTWDEYTNVSESKWKIGWTAGMGYERKIWDNWSLRAEYFYSSYENIIDTQSALRGGFPTTDGFTHKLDFTEHSFRIGLSMQF